MDSERQGSDPEAGVPPAEPAPAPPPADADSEQALLATQVTDPMEALVRASKHHPPPGRPAAGPEQRPPAVVGDYRLTIKLGEGAMGVVYKAEHAPTGREVAVKILFPHMAKNPKLLERFNREGRVLARLEHPAIVRGYGVGEEQGWYYFAMEYVDGRSLQKWLGLLGRLSVGDAVHIALACADALSYAHNIDLVHRDIKPDNILITRRGAVKLTDFGAVKLLDDDLSLTQTGNGIGTPCYMPLEQARNAKESDGRSDIYALGCVLYATLTGRPPFSGANLVELIQAKETAVFTPARRLNPDVPERLDLVIDKMVAKQVRYRYQNCAELGRDLRSLRLATGALSFIPSEGAAPAPPPPAPAPPVEPSTPPPTPVPTPAAPTPAGDWWYVRYKSAGKSVTRKLSKAEVLELARDPAFDPTATASRNLTEGYRSLARYKEFEGLLADRVTRSAADRHAARYRSVYRQMDLEAVGPREEAAEPAEGGDWVTLAYRLTLLAIAGGFVFVAARLLFRWLSSVPSVLS